MATITLRLIKGSPLTNNEVDNNFSNLNLAKVEIGGDLGNTALTPSVIGLRGRLIANTIPTNGQVLVYSSSANNWIAANGIISNSGSLRLTVGTSPPATGNSINDIWIDTN